MAKASKDKSTRIWQC